MGGKNNKPRKESLDKVVERAQADLGVISITGRYHRAPRVLEDDYRVDMSRPLGEGATGRVFRAYGADGMAYAVKKLRLSTGSQESYSQARKELEIHLSMDHPHVGRLIDVYEEGNHSDAGEWILYLVMELLSGGTLIDRVVETERFSEQGSANATWQLLLAVNYIHGKNVAHRDIKMDNILYPSVESDMLKLMDFGLSTVWSASDTPMSLACGATAYMAPEMLEEDYTTQADMWSCGVIAYILLVGKMPFNSADGIVHGKYRLSPKDKKTLSTGAQDFISKLLEPRPRKRMSAAQALDHEWLSARAMASTEIDRAVMHALIDFGKMSRLRRIVANLMATSLTEGEKTQLHEDFLRMDHDGDGVISLAEFNKTMKSAVESPILKRDDSMKDADVSPSSGSGVPRDCSLALIEAKDPAELAEQFGALDTNGGGSLTYTEFLAAVMYARLAPTEGHAMKAFQRFDIDGTGAISREDVAKFMGLEVQDTELDDAMKEMDSQEGKVISYQQWLAFLHRQGSGEVNGQMLASRTKTPKGLMVRIPSEPMPQVSSKWSMPPRPKSRESVKSPKSGRAQPKLQTLEEFLLI